MFYAYNHFREHPERLVGWFDQHMKQTGEGKKSGGERRTVAAECSDGAGHREAPPGG